jgi:quinoprotein glucose dehydrogenase
MMLRQIALLLSVFILTAALQGAGDGPPKDPYADRLAKASDEWKQTVQRMRLPSGVKADIWAAEPLVANIVSFAFDEKGRCYVAETFRLHAGVTDNRNHMNWLDDDLAARTVADRVAMYKKYLKGKFPDYEKEHDRVRLVEDTTGAGHADRASVFADGFSRAEDGIGSGVLARGGNVWYTCIPDLWLLKDTKDAGRADVKKSLHTGFGVHVSFLGHDLHGLKMGPDGKLYFSLGDRGMHVETGGKVVSVPDTGAVLRCNPDGSELEIVATGLRNPQELAFDEYGNLFTCDNNADGGDAARCVYVVEGGNSGWHIGYQYMPSLGPWNAEKLWHTEPSNTASYLVPPIAHIANGPSGLTYHPGTSLLPERFAKHFFLCDFRGSGAGSGVHSFALKPKGAGFEMVDRQQFAWGLLATDCDFGPDGGFYISDWVDGWGLTGKGRIFKLFDPDRLKDTTVAETKKLLAEGFVKRPRDELVKLLAHRDLRVRQEAQFALAVRKDVNAFVGALESKNRLARVHSIWGLGQIARPAARVPLAIHLNDQDAEIRAQVIKVLGDAKVASLGDAADNLHWSMAHVYSKAMTDPEPRVRFFGAIAAGKLGSAETVPTVLKLLKDNADADPYLRHAGVMALAGIGDQAIKQAAEDPSPSVRLAALVAMRRLGLSDVARFLKDTEPKLVLEAARAIYDVPIPSALPKLAELTQPGGGAKALPKEVQEPALLRALAAHYRLGTPVDTHALAEFAGRADFSEKLRTEALKLLGAWENPPRRDRIVGLWRPLPNRPAADVADAVRQSLAGIMTGPNGVRSEGAKLAAKHGIKEVGPVLRETVADAKRPSGVRVASLKALEALKDAELTPVAEAVLAGPDPRLRHEARRILVARNQPDDAVTLFVKVLDQGTSSTYERQGALAVLASINSPRADQALGQWLDRLVKKQAPPELELDILEAARKRAPLKPNVEKYEKTRPGDKSVAAYREALAGGDADAGRAIFFDKAEVSCLRCHKVGGVGGEVGPDLTGIGAKQKRDYLLESIVDPNKQIAKGYESIVLVLTDGQTKSGILKSEDAKEVRLMTPEGRLIAVPKDQIDERQRGPSAMPADLVQKMSRAELRDLVEFLASLTEVPKVGGNP